TGQQRCCSPAGDAFITKINGDASSLIYSSYLGGSFQEEGRSVAVDSSGNAYITGYTLSHNFPTTPGALRTVNNQNNSHAFATKVSSAGAMVYSTYLGADAEANDQGNGIAVDTDGNACVTGMTSG